MYNGSTIIQKDDFNMLSIYIRENAFGNRKKEYTFRSRTCGTVTLREFIRIMTESDTAVSEADAAAAMVLLERTFDKLIDEGYAVQLPMGTFKASASGTAESVQDMFSPESADKSEAEHPDHGISLIFLPDRKKEKALPHTVKVERTPQFSICRPNIACISSTDGQDASSAAPGEAVTLRGEYLKTDPADTEQGVFLCSIKPGCTVPTERRLTAIIRNARRTVTVMLPLDIPAGSYMFKLCARPGRRLLASYSAPFIIEAHKDAPETGTGRITQ